jgi:DNA primase
MPTVIERIYASLLDCEYQQVLFGDLFEFQRKGNAYISRCPFHQEILPTFLIHGDRPEYFCFVCSQRGDWLKFLQDRCGLTFSEALTRLAGAAGIDDAVYDKSRWKADLKRADLLERAMSFFITQLWSEKGSTVLKYLYNRGYATGEVEGMALGFYPGPAQIREYLFSQGFSEEHLDDKRSQLWKWDDDAPGLAIPYRDSSGRLMGIMCRDIELAGALAYRPLTNMEQLADIPFNMYRSRGRSEVIVVEGLFDALLLDQVRLKPAIGIGTGGFTEGQLETTISFGTQHYILALGNGKRQKEATRAAIGRIREKGLAASVLPIPRRYKDLDEYIRLTCLDVFRKLMNKTMSADQWITKKSHVKK